MSAKPAHEGAGQFKRARFWVFIHVWPAVRVGWPVALALLLWPAFAAVGLAAEGAAPEDAEPVSPAIVATPPGCLFTLSYALNNGAYSEGLAPAVGCAADETPGGCNALHKGFCSTA